MFKWMRNLKAQVWSSFCFLIIIVFIESFKFTQSTQILINLFLIILYSSLSMYFLYLSPFRKNLNIRKTLEPIFEQSDVTLFPLFLSTLLSGNLLFDFIKDFFDAEISIFTALSYIIMLSSFIFYCCAIAIHISSDQIEKMKKKLGPGNPVYTKGLVLSLSKANIEINKKLTVGMTEFIIDPAQFRKLFMRVSSYKSSEKWQNETTIKTIESSVDKLIDELNITPLENRPAFIRFVACLIQSNLYPALAAVHFHLSVLENIWVITTNDSKSSLELFSAILEKFYPENVKIKQEFLDDEYNINSIAKKVDHIYDNAQTLQFLQKDDMTADITGGTAPMSAGIILACIRAKRQVQYLRQDTFMIKRIDVSTHHLLFASKDVLPPHHDE